MTEKVGADSMAFTISRSSKRECRGYIAIIGGFLIHLTLGTIYSFGNLTTYVTSFIRAKHDPKFNYERATWIYTAAVVSQGVFMFLGGYLDRKVGSRWTTLVGCILFSGGVFSTAFAIDVGFWLVLISYGVLFGLGIAFAYIVPLSCGMKWFPQRKGLVNGAILGGFGLGAFVFAYVQTAFLNPDNKSVAASGYFEDPEILDRVPDLFMLLGGVYFGIQLVGILLLFSPKLARTGASSYATDDEVRRLVDGDGDDRHRRRHVLPVGGQGFNDFSNSGVVDLAGYDDSLDLSAALRTREFYMLWLTFFFNQQAIGFISTMYKAYGQTFISDDRFLALVGGVASIFNSTGRVFWGYLVDKTSYRRSMLLLTGLLSAWFFSLIATQEVGQWMFAAWVFLIFLTFCGNFALLPTATSETFGATHAAAIYGLVFTAASVSQPIQSLLTEALASLGWFESFCVTAGFVLMSAVITFFFDESPSPTKIRRRKFQR